MAVTPTPRRKPKSLHFAKSKNRSAKDTARKSGAMTGIALMLVMAACPLAQTLAATTGATSQRSRSGERRVV
jgi:hypothetical protein